MTTPPQAGPVDALARLGRALSAPLGPARAVALLGFFFYALMGRAVDNGLYPFSSFEMYAGGSSEDPSRLGVLDADGASADVQDFVGWRCEPDVAELDRYPERCSMGRGAQYAVDYKERDTLRWIERHRAASRSAVAGSPPPTRPPEGAAGAAAAPEPVRLIRRVWTFDADGRFTTRDCELAACTARRR